MRKHVRQTLTLLLTATLLCAAMLARIPALAVFEDDAIPAIPAAPEVDAVVELPEVGEETPSDGETVWGQAQPMSSAVFSVTVPTTLSIHMNANGGITCGNIVITNNGTESVVVEDAQITALNGWTLVDYATTTFTDANKGQHKVALQLESLDGAIAANGGQKAIDVATKIPYQGVQMINTSIAQVVFVLGWGVELPPPAPPNALQSFTIRVGAGGYRRNGATWSVGSTTTLYATSQVGSNVLYEGTCTLVPPYDNYVTTSVTFFDIPTNLEEGIMSIRAGNQDVVKQNGTWTGSSSLVPVYTSSVTFNVQLELTLDVSTTVKVPTPSTTPPTPTPT